MDLLTLHAATWQHLQERRRQLPHALLLVGQEGSGVVELAHAFTTALLCEGAQVQGKACGHCVACRWLQQHSHPDFRLLIPEAMRSEEEAAAASSSEKRKPSQQILIEQVRDLQDFLAVATHRQGLRVILLYPAESMNHNTANALLKMLEEPPAGTVFVLVTFNLDHLLPTIRSRCQKIALPVPPSDVATQFLAGQGVKEADKWLAMAGGVPLQALELAQHGEPSWLIALLQFLTQGAKGDPFVTASKIEQGLKESKTRDPLVTVVNWLQKWAIDLACVAQDLPAQYFVRQERSLQNLSSMLSPITTVRYVRNLITHRQAASQPLNTRLFLEDLCLDYQSLFAEQSHA